MTSPIFKASPKVAQSLSLEDILTHFNLDSEDCERVAQDLRGNMRSKSIVFHLNRFIENFNVGERLDEVKLNELYSICAILESMDSPIVPFPVCKGIKNYDEWKRDVSPIEYWNVDRVVSECRIVYNLVNVEFPEKVRYSKGDVYDMLVDLVRLGRVYSFKKFGDNGVFVNDEIGERESFFKRNVDVGIEVHRVLYPVPLKRER